ncbi:hypothetical protein DYB31_010586 [Aphanomyces astaci]|uniref:U2A'/phosphoprotein 32 family A C-terminal domain-containing protein n=1 Tax=Aphanomyces astaci TaxID=112090 RepID=A0A397EGH6_APHAT|nr:hypothetical protein DYB31_010586 [Aphanomyces astaci]
MPNTNRDDAQGPVDGGLKSLVKHNFHVAEATGQLNLAHMHLEQLPQSVQFLPRLVELDLSYNSLNRFPGQWVADHFKHLRVLAVEHNDLYCLDDILALSTLSKLESLNHCKQSQSATFPEPTKVPQLRYTIDGNAVPEPLQIESDDDNTGDDGFSKEGTQSIVKLAFLTRCLDMEVLRRELRLGLSFDGLANDQRCLVREKSKHSADASLKDNPFNANVVLDNMIQAERSRY